MERFLLNLRSGNKKTGPIPVSTSPKNTCPNSCPFKEKGCYAKYGPLGFIWSALSEFDTQSQPKNNAEKHIKNAAISWSQLIARIKSLPDRQLWRHNQSGDLRGSTDNPDNIDAIALSELVEANRGKRGFTYTHRHTNSDGTLNQENIDLVRKANKEGFTINLSANSPEEAAKFARLGLPTVTVLPMNCERVTFTENGHKIVQCPATIKGSKSKNCAQCGLCAVSRRGYSIGFPAHGAAKKHVGAIAKN